MASLGSWLLLVSGTLDPGVMVMGGHDNLLRARPPPQRLDLEGSLGIERGLGLDVGEEAALIDGVGAGEPSSVIPLRRLSLRVEL
jgi:hypothetical protein